MEDNSSSSSMVTGFSQASVLQRTLERLSCSQKVNTEEAAAAPVAVIALQRYLCEQTEGQQVDSYSYDVTVTDGVWRAKCFVHPALNHLVHSNILRTGTDISITQCSFVYNERRLGHGYMCIEKLRCAAQSSAVLPRIKDVTSLPMLVKHGMERSVVLQSDVPLQVSRKHYLSLWNNDDPEGDIWTSGSSSSDTVLDVSKITLLCSLESCFRKTWKPLPLLVKIIHKSRLRYYGKIGHKIDYPYQAYFEVADQSGTMSLVLWNELCPEFYQRLNVGTVLYIQNYTLKQSYSNRSHPQMDHHKMKSFNSVEICLNPRNPTSVITVISPKSVLPQWGLPEVSYQFTTRSELEKLSNNAACDVIGLVTFVGRVERVKSKGNKGPEKYWTYRWIHAVDGTTDLPFILEVFSSSQPEIFSRICPMTYLVCTQMRVCRVEGSLPYLTSSCETQTFITGYHKGQPYVSDPRVKSFIQWTKTLKDNVVLQRTAVGGYYCYPRPPKTFTQSMADASAQTPLVAAADLKKELETLQYREHKKLAIQGQITAVRYMKNPKTTGGTEEKAAPDACEQAVPDTHIHSSTAEQTLAEKISESGRKRRIQTRKAAQSSLSCESTSAKRRHQDTEEGQEQGEEESNAESGAAQDVECRLNQNQDSDVLSWEGSSWPRQQEEVSEHLCQGGLYQDSVSRRFTFDEKNGLLQQSNLQPTRWTPEQSADTIPPVVCPGYYQVTILVRHTLRYALTASSGEEDFMFVGVAEVDGIVALHCDSIKNTMEPKQDWVRKINEDNPQHLEWHMQHCFQHQPIFFKTTINSLQERFNQSGDVHIFQRMIGCDWDDETGEVNAFNQFGYDGEDLISLDLKTLTWVAPKPQAYIIKMRWDADKIRIQNNKEYLTKIFPEWLKKYLSYSNISLLRTEPSVFLLQKTPSSPVSCHATGFFPNRAMMFWRKDKEEIHEDVEHGEILPNHDGTFQMSVDLHLSSVTPEDWWRYDCVFHLSGVKDDIVTRLDEAVIRTNRERPSNMTTPIVAAVVVLALFLVAAFGFMAYKKKKAKDPPSPPDNSPEVSERLNPDK